MLINMKNKLSTLLHGIAVATLGTIAVTLSSTPASAAGLTPTLWGVDEDDGQLFSIGDYNDVANTFTDYGLLKWDDGGTLKNVGADIEAFTLDTDGTAYLALDRGIGEFDDIDDVNTLLSFNIQDAVAGNTVVDILGVIGADVGNGGINYNSSSDNISGLSIDPITGKLVALLKNNGSRKTDQLYTINKTDGGLVDSIGTIQGLGETSKSAEDLEFDNEGNLYVTDNKDDHLYQVDRDNGNIIAVIDNNQKDGFKNQNGDDATSIKIEALGWDFVNNKLITNDDNYNGYGQLTLQNGNNNYFGTIAGLTDVEGIDFVPTTDGNPISNKPKKTPEPSSFLGLLALGTFGISSSLRRKQ